MSQPQGNVFLRDKENVFYAFGGHMQRGGHMPVQQHQRCQRGNSTPKRMASEDDPLTTLQSSVQLGRELTYCNNASQAPSKTLVHMATHASKVGLQLLDFTCGALFEFGVQNPIIKVVGSSKSKDAGRSAIQWPFNSV